MPLRWDGAVRGVLCEGYTAVGVASPARLGLLEDFGVLAAGAFRNAALQSELARTARTDGLTGCVTQTALYAALEEELQRCARQQLPLSVIAQLDAVIDELHDDLVRRSIVHLRTLREDLQAAAQRRC